MFETCSTLAELNRERQSLIAKGVPAAEVNSAYNKAKQRLIQATPSFRKIPKFLGTKQELPVYTAIPLIQGEGNLNEIVFTAKGVLL